jgi:hypothetical protein
MQTGDTKHEFEFVPLAGGMLDQIKCSCGWLSATYFDGAEYAIGAWNKHVTAESMKLVVANHPAEVKENVR